MYQAHEAGRVLDEDAIRASERTNDAMNIFNSSLKGVVNQGIAALLPAIEGLANFLSGTVSPFLTGTLIPAMQSFIKDGIEAVTKAIEDLQPVFEVVWEVVKVVVTTVIQSLTDRINGFVTVLKGIVAFFKGVFTGDFSAAWNGIKQIFAGVLQGMLGALRPFLAALESIPFIGGKVKGAVEAVEQAIEDLKGETDKGTTAATRHAAALGSEGEQARDNTDYLAAAKRAEEQLATATANAAAKKEAANAALEARINSLTGALSRNARAQIIAATIQSAALDGTLGIDVAGGELGALISRQRVFDAIDSGIGQATVGTAGAIRLGGGGGGGGGSSSTPSGALAGGGGISQLTRIAGQRLGEISSHTFFSLEPLRETARNTDPEHSFQVQQRAVYRGVLSALAEFQRSQPATQPPALSGTETVLNLISPAQRGTTRSSTVGAPA